MFEQKVTEEKQQRGYHGYHKIFSLREYCFPLESGGNNVSVVEVTVVRQPGPSYPFNNNTHYGKEGMRQSVGNRERGCFVCLWFGFFLGLCMYLVSLFFVSSACVHRALMRAEGSATHSHTHYTHTHTERRGSGMYLLVPLLRASCPAVSSVGKLCGKRWFWFVFCRLLYCSVHVRRWIPKTNEMRLYVKTRKLRGKRK